jgi:phosphoserine phosphatase
VNPTTVLATVTGRDRPGVTAAFFSALAAHDIDVLDVEQVVVRDRLILAVLLSLNGEPHALRTSVTKAAEALGVEADVEVIDGSGVGGSAAAARIGHGRRSHVIVIGRSLRPGTVGHIAQRIADLGGNIESVAQLSTEPATALEFTVRIQDHHQLRAALVQASEDLGVDIAVEPAGLRRRATRLVVMDVDSTLIQDEGIDVLAERAGVADQVKDITARAMAGELDFAASLRSRVSLLAGLPVSEVEAVRDSLRLTPGARTFVRTLKRLGYAVGVVSGGFTIFTDHLVADLGLDFAAANELEIADGRLTGQVLGPIVDRAGKAEALRRFADQFHIPLDQTVAVGDGANDIDMIETAGLGIAFNAKAALRTAADTSVTLPYLDTVLFMLGIGRDEIEEAAL